MESETTALNIIIEMIMLLVIIYHLICMSFNIRRLTLLTQYSCLWSIGIIRFFTPEFLLPINSGSYLTSNVPSSLERRPGLPCLIHSPAPVKDAFCWLIGMVTHFSLLKQVWLVFLPFLQFFSSKEFVLPGDKGLAKHWML